MKHLCHALFLWLAERCTPAPELKKYRVASRHALPEKQRRLLRRLARKLNA